MCVEDPRINPPDYTDQIEVCPVCKNKFLTHDRIYRHSNAVRYAYWDINKEIPLCSQECLEDYEEENGWEFEEEEN